MLPTDFWLSESPTGFVTMIMIMMAGYTRMTVGDATNFDQLCFEELDASAQLPPRDLSCALWICLHRSLEGSWCNRATVSQISMLFPRAIGTTDVLFLRGSDKRNLTLNK